MKAGHLLKSIKRSNSFKRIVKFIVKKKDQYMADLFFITSVYCYFGPAEKVILILRLAMFSKTQIKVCPLNRI